MTTLKRLLLICTSVSLALVTFISCGEEKQNQPLSYVPEAKLIGKTETDCDIYDTKNFKAKTAYEDYAITISPTDNIDTEFSVNIPRIELKNQNKLNKVNEALYNNGLLGDLLSDPDVLEFESGYGITFAEYNVVSICQHGSCSTAMHNIEFARGCTFDRDTDTILSVDKYFDTEKLLDLYDSGELKIYMDQGYDDATIRFLLQDYVDFSGDDTNFFINQDSIFLIVPVSGANSTYIIVEAGRK